MTITTAGFFTRDAPIAERFIAIIAGLTFVGHTIAAGRQLATASAGIGGFVIIPITVITSFNLKPQGTIATSRRDTVDAGIAGLVIAIVAALFRIGDTIATGGQPTVCATGVRSIIVVGFTVIASFNAPSHLSIAAASFGTVHTTVALIIVRVITGLTNQCQNAIATAGGFTGIGTFIPGLSVAIVADLARINTTIAAAFSSTLWIASITGIGVTIIASFHALLKYTIPAAGLLTGIGAVISSDPVAVIAGFTRL